jgi:hypothetical protein
MSKVAGQAEDKNDPLNKVMVSVWQDSGIVRFCTTIHNRTEWANRNRKKPRNTSTSAAITKRPFVVFNTTPIVCCQLLLQTASPST